MLQKSACACLLPTSDLALSCRMHLYDMQQLVTQEIEAAKLQSTVLPHTCSADSTASSARNAALRSAATGLPIAVIARQRSSWPTAGVSACSRPPTAAAAAASANALLASTADWAHTGRR